MMNDYGMGFGIGLCLALGDLVHRTRGCRDSSFAEIPTQMTPWQVSGLRRAFHRTMRMTYIGSSKIQSRAVNGGSGVSIIAPRRAIRIARRHLPVGQIRDLRTTLRACQGRFSALIW